MRCPVCDLENPPSTERCDCGHAFVANASPMQPTARPRPSQSSKLATKMLYAAVIATVIGVIISIAMNSGSTSTNARVSEIKSESLEDRAFKTGCGQFARLVVDTRKGILTDQEIREKAKQIRLNFHSSEKPAAKEAGDRLLRAFTVGNRDDWNASFKEMRELCGY